jgi:hypothetical protein
MHLPCMRYTFVLTRSVECREIARRNRPRKTCAKFGDTQRDAELLAWGAAMGQRIG